MKKCIIVVLLFLISFSLVFAMGSKVEEDLSPFEAENTEKISGRAEADITNQFGNTEHIERKLYILVDKRVFTDPENSSANLVKGTDYELSKTFSYDFNDSGIDKITSKSAVLVKKGKIYYYNELSDGEKTLFKNFVKKVAEDKKNGKDRSLSSWEQAIMLQMQATDDIFTEFTDMLKISFLAFTQGKAKNETSSTITDKMTEDLLDIGDGAKDEYIDVDTITSSLDQGKKYISYILLTLLTLEIITIGIVSFAKGTIPFAELTLKVLMCIFLMFMITNIWDIMRVTSSIFVKGGVVAANTTQAANSDYSSDETFGFSSETYQKSYKTYVEDFNKKHKGEVIIRPSQVLNMSYAIQRQLLIAEDNIKDEISPVILFKNLKTLLVWVCFLIVRVILLIVFMIITLYIMLWQIELKILIIIATFLLPFKIFRYTDFLAKGIWSTLLGQCVKLFTASYLINVSSFILEGSVQALFDDISFETFDLPKLMIVFIPLLLMIVCLVAYFILKVPETARAVLIGQPTTDGNLHGAATRLTAKGLTAPTAAVSAINTPLKGGKVLGEALDDAKNGKKGILTAAGGGIGTLLAYGGIKALKKFKGEDEDDNPKTPRVRMDGSSF